MDRWPAVFVLLLMAAATTWSSFLLAADARQLEPAHAAGGSCIGRERDALLAFKQGINDTGGYLESWQAGRQDCCRWAGITCNNVTGNVIRLDLGSRYSLAGQISPSLLSLEHLEFLNLNNTALTGPNGRIPEFLGSFKNLRHLDLSYMEFTGTVPPQLGNLSKLEYLDLSRSGMYSTDISWLTRLPLLVYLDMTFMNLSYIAADWPLVVNMLPSLEQLYLIGCSLSSANRSLTHQNLTNLQHLDLSLNYFGHTIASAWFWNVTSITYLDLFQTSMSGSFPNALGNMTSLRVLSFGCDIPELIYPATTSCNMATMTVDLKNLCDLEELQLDGSLSSGNITKFIEKLPRCPSNRLQYLGLGRNNMVGMMVDGLGQLASLTDLDLSKNNITGSIPLSIGNLSHLEGLDLSNNNITGSIQLSIGNLPHLEYLDLSNNHLTGPIPLGIANCTKLAYLSLSSNLLTGHVPTKIGTLSNLTELDLSNNNLDGMITEEHLVSLKSLNRMDLSNNSISGSLPSVYGAPGLIDLTLSFNHLSGHIPESIFCKLRTLDLSNNFLEGDLPSCSHKPNLAFLHLSHNRISGKFPSALQTYSSLAFMDLSKNNFSGTLPLVGGISDGVTSLNGLLYLNLSWNQLSGKIPANIGAMKSIESLDLSRNKLYGEIPSSLSDLTYLSSLDLSYNNLEGRIPHGSQLDTLYMQNPSIYTGNIALCGPPLERNCLGVSTPEHENQKRRQNSEPVLFFYFGLGSGFVAGLWVVFCTLLFRKAWRVAFFRLFDKLYDHTYVFMVVSWGRITNGWVTAS